MQILKKIRKGDAVYWAPARDASGRIVTDAYGKPTYDAPREIKVRWQQNQELYTANTGEQRVSKAQVFVGEDLELGGILYEGKLSSISPSLQSKPKQVFKASEILGWVKMPTLDYKDNMRKALL